MNRKCNKKIKRNLNTTCKYANLVFNITLPFSIPNLYIDLCTIPWFVDPNKNTQQTPILTKWECMSMWGVHNEEDDQQGTLGIFIISEHTMLQFSSKWCETCVSNLLNINPKVHILNPYIIYKKFAWSHLKSILIVMELYTFYCPKIMWNCFIKFMTIELNPPYAGLHVVLKMHNVAFLGWRTIYPTSTWPSGVTLK